MTDHNHVTATDFTDAHARWLLENVDGKWMLFAKCDVNDKQCKLDVVFEQKEDAVAFKLGCT